MTDQEINEAVARKLGWCACDHEIEHHSAGQSKGEMICSNAFCKCESIRYADYCHSIAAAWEVVEHLKEYWVGIRYKPSAQQFNAVIANDDKALSEEVADTAPMAICLAFLKLP